MKDSFLVSVITPFYNGNKYMKQLFDVLENNLRMLRKDYPNANLELVIVNDSPSSIVEIPDVNTSFIYKIVNHEKNAGIHQARVTGLNNCNGDYILFLDQDDVLLERAIVSQIKILFEKNADAVICNAYMEKEDGSSYLLYKSKTDFRLLNDLDFYLKSHNIIKSPGQCLIKKNSIPPEWMEYIMKRNGADDLFLWILLLEQSTEFIVNKEALYIHKYTGVNLSNSEEKMNDSTLEIVKIASEAKCIPEKHVVLLKRSRDFISKFRRPSIIMKCGAILKNMDLFVYLLFNKLKRSVI